MWCFTHRRSRSDRSTRFGARIPRMIAISQGGLGAYWMARREDAGLCAERLLRCLNGLRAISPIFASWLAVRGRTREQVLATPESLRDLLLAGRNRMDFPPHDVIEKLGYSADLVNSPSPQEQIGFRVVCGMYASDSGLINHCVLKFAAKGDFSYDAIPLDVKVQALSVLVESWDPDWAALRSRSLSKAIQSARGKPVEPFFGWISFVAQRMGKLPERVQNNFYHRTLGGASGELIYATRDKFDDHDPQSLGAAIDLYVLLEGGGLLDRNFRKTHGSHSPE